MSAYSDYRFRGLSLSDGRPVGILDLSYDAPNGLYGALSGSLVATRHDGVKPLRLALNGGYAKRVSHDLTADVGIVHSRYSEYSGLTSGRAYTEFYAGLSEGAVGARFSVSPNYLGPARWTLHGELNGHTDLGSNFVVDATIGALVPLRRAAYGPTLRAQWDARLGIARRIGAVSLHAAVAARGPHSDIYGGGGHRRTALIVGISAAL